MCQKHSEQLLAAGTTTYHDRDLVVILFRQVYQIEVIVDQIFQTAMEVPAWQDWFLQPVALDSSQTELHNQTTHIYSNVSYSTLKIVII